MDYPLTVLYSADTTAFQQINFTQLHFGDRQTPKHDRNRQTSVIFFNFVAARRTTSMKYLKSIAEYFKEVNLPLPKDPDFFVGRQEDAMHIIKPVLKPIKHELYSISVIKSGDRLIKLDHSVTRKVFIRSPFKTIEWDFTDSKIRQGVVIIFSSEFIRNNILWNNCLLDFPFFRHSAFFNEDLAAPTIDEL